MPASWLPLERRAEIRLPARDRCSSKKLKFFAFSSTNSVADGVFLLPNALRRERNPSWSTGFSLGVDLGSSRTGLALGKGLAPPRPLIGFFPGAGAGNARAEIGGSHNGDCRTRRGGRVHHRPPEISRRKGDAAIEQGPECCWKARRTRCREVFSSSDQSFKSGRRVFLQDEHGTSVEALNYMIDAGLKKSARQRNVDSYAAVMVLERYFSDKGHGAELVLPKKPELQDRLKQGLYIDDEL